MMADAVSENKFVRAIVEEKGSNPEFARVVEPIEAESLTQLTSAALAASSPFDNSTNQVEMHLARSQALLNTCIELRKAAHDLESEAVKAVWNNVVVTARTETERGYDDAFYTHRKYANSEQYDKALPVPDGQTPITTYDTVLAALADRRVLV
jgi:hypothetical protein